MTIAAGTYIQVYLELMLVSAVSGALWGHTDHGKGSIGNLCSFAPAWRHVADFGNQVESMSSVMWLPPTPQSPVQVSGLSASSVGMISGIFVGMDSELLLVTATPT
jgi:hypothetical protein